MRRKDRALTKESALAILDKAEYGVLSTIAETGEPYGVPLNFCVIDNNLFFHCAVEGQKTDNIKQNNSVSFCAVGNTKVMPDKFGTKYESVIVAGKAVEVFNEVKQAALESLLHKYSPNYFDKGKKYIESFTEKTRVFKIVIETLSGKAKK